MYTAEDYFIALVGLLVFSLVLLFIDWAVRQYDNWQSRKRWIAENRHKLRQPKRQGRSYVQEWEELLETVDRGRGRHV